MFRSTQKTSAITYTSWQLIRDTYGFLRPYRRKFWLATLVRLIGDIVHLLPGYALASVVNFFSVYKAGDSLNPIWLMVGLFIFGTFVRSISQFFAKYWGYFVAEKVGIDSSLLAVRHIFQLDMAWHEQKNAGSKLKRIQNGSESLNSVIRLWFNCCIEIGVNLIAINLIIGTFDLLIMFLLIVFVFSYIWISRSLIIRASKTSHRVNLQQETYNGHLFEALSNIRTVKLMLMAKIFNTNLKNQGETLSQLIKKRILSWNLRSTAISLLSGTAKVVIMAIIIWGIVHQYYSLGFLILFNTYFSRILESAEELATASQDFVTAKISVARMQSLLAEPITIDSEENKLPFPQAWREIAFKKVSFAYGDNKVLKNISFTVKRGEKVGIVGLSGAGKSTILKLLLKEREEFTGDVLFDGISIRDISKNAYFEHVSVVLQDTEVFNFSLKDNITITNASKKKNTKLFKQSLEVAHITDLVQKLPQGLHTVIGEKGVKLSGGERQRLGIARAIFKQPQILLLDEATSHLDLESEEKIRDSLHQFFENVTAIVIAHRLTTIREMDKILVIEDGKLIESGSFEHLLKAKGRFYQLWEKQGL